MADRKVILTIAPTGGMADKTVTPHLPTQPQEIADDVVRCWEAGASIVAVHARRPDDGATCNAEIYGEINRLISSRCDIVINNSTGGGISGDMVREFAPGRKEIAFEERIKGTMAGAEMCTFDPHMQNMHKGDLELLLDTSWSRCIELGEAMKERDIKPEWEIMSLSDLNWVNELIAMGFDKPPYYINIVLGTHKLMSGATAYTPKNLQRFVEDLPENSLFCVSGIGPAQLPSSVHSLILGGQARVGLEDNVYYSRGRLATNVELVERMVRILHELNLEPATPAQG
jgi:3-keto-5-aminohexanoate cleavage enzyme